MTRGRLINPRVPGVGLSEHIPNSVEPVPCPARTMVTGRFVPADVPVIFRIRFRTETSWRTMDREASAEGTTAPAGAETWRRCDGSRAEVR